jgi:hypothetical protein
MQYIIRNFDESKGQLTVEYANKWTYAVDLPVENGAFPIGEKLEEIIQGVAPVWQLERETMLAVTPANADIIRTLVQPLPVQEPFVMPISLQESALESDISFIKEIVNEVLVDKGL